MKNSVIRIANLQDLSSIQELNNKLFELEYKNFEDTLVNKKTFELEQENSSNKMNLLNILLKETYEYCKGNLDILDDDKTLKNI